MDLDDKNLEELFQLADRIGKKPQHRLTQQDFEDYRQFDRWRYVNGDSECGTTPASKQWVKDNSDWTCPICDQRFADCGGRTIDHKLPRSQYPWLSLNFENLWVICQTCNKEKSDMHWFEYERYILKHYPDRFSSIQTFRPTKLIKSLKT